MILKSLQATNKMLPDDAIKYAAKHQKADLAEKMLSELTPLEEYMVRFIEYSYDRPETNDHMSRMEIRIDTVVRCFDCKWFSAVVPTRCTRSYGMPVSSEDFCSFGERKDSYEDR